MNSIEELKENYKTSNDYAHLKDLIMSGKKIIAFVTYVWDYKADKENPIMATDVIELQIYNAGGKYETIIGGCRGTSFITVQTKNSKYTTFEEECKRYKLEYIEPNV